jgi:hypothetical protein
LGVKPTIIIGENQRRDTMTIFRNIENWAGDKANLLEKVSHVDSDGNLISSYEELRDKPLINGVVLQGDLTLDELNIQEKGDFALREEVEILEKDIEENLTKKVADIEEAVPTKVSELENDKGYLITEEDPTVPGHVKDIKLADITRWNAKSDFSGSYNDLINKPTNLLTKEEGMAGVAEAKKYADDKVAALVDGAPGTMDTLNELASALNDNKDVVAVLNDAMVDKANIKDLKAVAFSGSYNDLIDKPTINDFDNDFVTKEYVDELVGDINLILSTLTEVK